LVDDQPGVTRDRRFGDARLGDLRFQIVDTAGFEEGKRKIDQFASAATPQIQKDIATDPIQRFSAYEKFKNCGPCKNTFGTAISICWG
jgi:hypothetical protein